MNSSEPEWWWCHRCESWQPSWEGHVCLKRYTSAKVPDKVPDSAPVLAALARIEALLQRIVEDR